MHLERRAVAGFALVAVIVFAIGWLIYANDSRLRDERSAVVRSFQTIATLEAALSVLQDVETGQRGYLLTGDRAFLDPYTSGVGRLDETLGGLRTLAAGDPVMLEQLARLETLAAEKVDLARRAIALRDTEGSDASEQLAAAGGGKAVMDEARSLVASMQRAETDRLQSRLSASDVTTRNNTILTRALAILSHALFAALLIAITRSLALQRRASETGARLAAIAGASGDAIVSLDLDGRIASWNPGAERMFGYSASEAMGQHVSLIAGPGETEPQGALLNAVRDGRRASQETVRMAKDGSLVDISLDAFPIYGSGGSLVCLGAVLRDITAAKRAQRLQEQLESALLQAKEAAEDANRAKSVFLSRMSHELRTPLNVVLGFGQVLQLDPLAPQQAESVDYILKAGRHLLELIDEVLDISRIEAGRISLSIEPVNVRELVSDSLLLMAPIADQRGITLRYNNERDDFVLADRHRLRQVILNLISNAIKYNNVGGHVDVTCAAVDDLALRIMVADTGRGISPDKMERLFVAFDRLGAEATIVEGTGLGLTLCKYLVEAMGGTIGVESAVDAGSMFWFELPVTEATHTAPEGAPAHRSSPRGRLPADRLVLYVEDNLANFRLIERIFLASYPSFRVVGAMQGSVGLQLARAHHPDLVLLDLHLPDTTGNHVLRELKGRPDTQDIPVVMISADATPGQRDRILGAGAAAYLSKPIDVREFLDLLDSLFPVSS